MRGEKLSRCYITFTFICFNPHCYMHWLVDMAVKMEYSF